MKTLKGYIETYYYRIKYLYYDIVRPIKAKYQILTKGYADMEVWDLFWHISKYTLPRLKRLKERKHGYPIQANSMEEYQESLQKMIDAFQLIVDEDYYSKEGLQIVDEGLNEFRKYFLSLWD